jgi:hypothetical protein
MKNKLLYLSLFILATVGICGCNYLDKEPDDMKTDEMIWKSRVETEKYLNNVYSQIPGLAINLGDPFLGCSDEYDYSWNVYPSYNVNLGNWNPSSSFYDKWAGYYKAIRSSFVFESNVDNCPELSDDLKNQYKAEVQFLRGYYYWLILRQYGPAILIKEATEINADWNAFARAPYDECVTYICDMMDKAEKGLPLSWSDNLIWLGKPTKVTCRSIKSEVLIMAASPQWNGNQEYSIFKNKDGTSLVNTAYDENKWKKAAQASLDVITLAQTAGVKLYKNNENGDGTVFNPYKSVRDAVTKAWNCEIIFARPQALAGQTDILVHTSPGPNNLGGAAPTQRVVDAFYMKNGRTIEDTQSGYVETGFATIPGDNWNPKNLNVTTDRIKMIADIRNGDAWGHWTGEWNMYANREPRFYASVLYNKRIIPQLPDDIVKRNYYNSTAQQNGYARVELYYGGTSRSSGSYTFFPRSGYLGLKSLDPQANMRDRVYANNHCEVFIRYAKILLNCIESLNEYDPANPKIAEYWNLIRERAGIPGIFDVYPDIKGNKDKQREYIIRERQVELAFESDRYFTTRRLWLAHTPDSSGDTDRKFGDGGRMWGMDINAGVAASNNFDFTGFYKRVPFETRVFEKKFYVFPIPQGEIDKCKSLVQNPWW